ncbi:MAG TPA: metallophosphoesterase [Dissulfurispiraceae bacterium]|nr:metallophosphoesterase [Dissulfurispiraceae bacterium]
MNIDRRNFIKTAIASLLTINTTSVFADISGKAETISRGEPAKERKKVFISDIHMSEKRSLDKTGHRYDWFRKDDSDHLAALLMYLSQDDTVEEVILLGDIMDTWVYPIDEPPPSYKNILLSNMNIVEGLKAIKAKKEVIYIRGNHDMDVKADDLIIDKTSLITRMQDVYCSDNIHAEHGHHYDMFNYCDQCKYPVPFGYFVARLATTIAARGNEDYSVLDFRDTFVDNLWKAVIHRQGLTPRAFSRERVRAIITTLIDEIKKADSTRDVDKENITLPKQIFGKESMPIGDIIDMYADYFVGKPLNVLEHSIITELTGHLDYAANDIALHASLKKKRVVIFGHTHNKEIKELYKVATAKVSPYSPIDESDPCYGIYGNCGSWCETRRNKPLTYIETVAAENSNEVKVRLKHWDIFNESVMKL